MSRVDVSHNLSQSNASSPIDLANPDEAVLNRQREWNMPLQALRSHIIQSDEKGLPRYGVLSILCRRVPFHLYDHPALMAMCDSAFTDGIHIFVNTEFFKQVQAEDKERDESGHRRHSMILILLHELSHILFRHHNRMPPKSPPLLWAIACDIAINSRLLTGYPQLRPGPVFDNAWGSQAKEIKRYLGQSEEHILNSLWEDDDDDSNAVVQQLKQQLQNNSSGAGGGPGTGSADDAPPQEPEVTPDEDERGKPLDTHHHIMTPEQLARLLDQNGMNHIRETLTLPDPNDKTGYQTLHSTSQLRLVSDIDKAREIRDLHPAGSAMAGNHIEDVSSEWIEHQYRGQLEWRNLLRDLVIGQGVQYQHCDEIPSELYFIDPEHMNLDAPLFIGSQTPASPSGTLLCVVDTSRSVNPDMLKLFFGELARLIEQETVQQGQLFLTSADTTFRGDMLKFSPHDLVSVPARLLAHGRGGTDIKQVIVESMHWAEHSGDFDQQELEAIIYFTDLLDKPPQRSELPKHLPKLVFITPPSLMLKSFREQMASFAQIAEIREGTLIDLCPN